MKTKSSDLLVAFLAASLSAACVPPTDPEVPPLPPPPGPMLKSEAAPPDDANEKGDAAEAAPAARGAPAAGSERRVAATRDVAPEMLPTLPLDAPVGETLSQARQHALFRQFHLREVARTPLQNGTAVVSFRPASPKIAPLVEVAALIDEGQIIQRFSLAMRRSFVDAKATNQLARDLALVFLDSAVSRVDGRGITPLALDIFERGRRRVAGPPTAAFEVFAGERQLAHFDFSYSHVTFLNQVDQSDGALHFVVHVEAIPAKSDQTVWH